jgi:hypothetical protein
MREQIETLTKRLEAEINKTPSGDLRNLLTDANVLIQALNIHDVSKRLKELKIWYPDAHKQFDGAEIYWEEDPDEITSMGKKAIGVVKYDDLLDVINDC